MCGALSPSNETLFLIQNTICLTILYVCMGIPFHVRSKRLRLASEQIRTCRRKAHNAAVYGGDPARVATASRDNAAYRDMGLVMDADSLQNGGRLRKECHWDSNDKFLVRHTPWEFLGVYVTDGSSDFEAGRITLGMYFPAIRVVRAFALQLYHWETLAGGHRSIDSFKLQPQLIFGTDKANRKPHPKIVSGAKFYSSTAGDDNVGFDFNLDMIDIEDHLRKWEVIGPPLLAFATERRAILDKTVSGVEVRRKSDDFQLLEVDTEKRLVRALFQKTV